MKYDDHKTYLHDIKINSLFSNFLNVIIPLKSVHNDSKFLSHMSNLWFKPTIN